MCYCVQIFYYNFYVILITRFKASITRIIFWKLCIQVLKNLKFYSFIIKFLLLICLTNSPKNSKFVFIILNIENSYYLASKNLIWYIYINNSLRNKIINIILLFVLCQCQIDTCKTKEHIFNLVNAILYIITLLYYSNIL